MDQPSPSTWRARFERGRQDHASAAPNNARPTSAPAQGVGYDDGHDPGRHGAMPTSPRTVADEAAMALAGSSRDYRPWTLQRGPQPVQMLHLRRFDARSALWTGWALAYAFLSAIEYVGAELISLDFGARQFMLEGNNLTELVDHLQNGSVTCIQEFTSAVWPGLSPGPAILRIRSLGQQAEGG